MRSPEVVWHSHGLWLDLGRILLFMVEGLLFLGLLNASRQLLILGGFRPLHAIDGTIETFGSEAGTGLSFGFEGHFSFILNSEVQIVTGCLGPYDCSDSLCE